MRTPQFSLANLFLLAALTGSVIALVLHRREIAELTRKQQEVFQATGYLDVDDPTKVYVRELFSPALLTWRFQIYIPPEHRLQYGVGTGLVGDPAYPTRLIYAGTVAGTGEQQTVTFCLARDWGNRWRISKKYRHGGTSNPLADGDYAWLAQQEWDNSLGVFSPDHGPLRVHEPDERIPILILRSENTGGEAEHKDRDLIIWLEPDVKAKFDERVHPDGD